MILLTTINARYQHASLGLRYLLANLGPWQAKAVLREYTLESRPEDIVEEILSLRPEVVGFGVYIWNVNETLQTLQILKKVAPQIKVILGGPEVSYEFESHPIVKLADTVILGEEEKSLRVWCDDFFGGTGTGVSSQKIMLPEPPDIAKLKFPYELFTEEDIKNRVLYVEASRGCAYRCEFCLSALDEKVRLFSQDAFLEELDKLIARGARQFKFVDRTFNLNIQVSSRILDFFLERIGLGLFLHFEMVPERLPEELRSRIKLFPQGTLQFEVGIQTLNAEVSRGISRPQNYDKIFENLKFLKNETGVHLHTDLIVGLPGEDRESFGRGFDILFSLRPHEIQVGILKRLKGMPLNRQTESAGLVFSDSPPYSILKNNWLSFEEVQGFKRFAKFWDLVANKGNYPRTILALETMASESRLGSFFATFEELTQFLSVRHPKLHSIGLPSLTESLFRFAERKEQTELFGPALALDYSANGKRELPEFLKPFAPPESKLPPSRNLWPVHLPERQRRHAEGQGPLDRH